MDHANRPPQFTVETMTEKDWPAVSAIYAEGIATGNATFQKSIPEWNQWDSDHLRTCRLVVRSGQDILGWAALTPVSGRCVYAGVAEVSVYVAERSRGQKVGLKLLQTLVEASERAGIWSLQAGIFPENIASIQLHKRCGFVVVGTRTRLGRMDGRWRDVCLMERRSDIVGID